MLIVSVIIAGCGQGYKWRVEEGTNNIIIQLNQVDSSAIQYYAEITLVDGRRIATSLGLPDKDGKFILKNTFGEFTNIIIYNNIQLE